MGDGAKRSFIGRASAEVIGGRILWKRFSMRQGTTTGLSLVEVLVAIAILALIITLPLVTMSTHQAKKLAVDDRGIAWQAIANEIELQRARDFAELHDNATEPFISLNPRSPLSALPSTLENPVGTVRVKEEIGGVAQVTLRLEWGKARARKQATVTILRADVPGGSLFG